MINKYIYVKDFIKKFHIVYFYQYKYFAKKDPFLKDSFSDYKFINYVKKYLFNRRVPL